jgi:KDO2-lipid IV(A) lauroyltransferase
MPVRLGLLRLFVWLLGRAPATLLTALSRPLGKSVWRFSNTRRSSTRRNLAACYPALDDADREQLGRESMRHFAMTALETGMCWSWSEKRLRRHFIEPVGFELLQEELKAGRGVLLLVPHFGNWELLNHWIQFHLELLALYKPGRSEELERAVVENRCRFGARMVPTTPAGLKQLYRHAKDGKLVAILPDQDPSDGKGRFIPFFGVPALTGVLAARLVQQTGCRVLFGACRRVAGSLYQPHFLAAENDIHDSDTDVALAALNRGVERVVALDPAQYLWAYKRFKSRPAGEPPFY